MPYCSMCDLEVLPACSGVGFPWLSSLCSTASGRADLTMCGCAIPSVTFPVVALSDASWAFLCFFLLRIQSFSTQTRSNRAQLKPRDLQTGRQRSLPAVFPPCPCRDETSSDDRAVRFLIRTKRCIRRRWPNPSLVGAWLHPF